MFLDYKIVSSCCNNPMSISYIFCSSLKWSSKYASTSCLSTILCCTKSMQRTGESIINNWVDMQRTNLSDTLQFEILMNFTKTSSGNNLTEKKFHYHIEMAKSTHPNPNHNYDLQEPPHYLHLDPSLRCSNACTNVHIANIYQHNSHRLLLGSIFHLQTPAAYH